MGYEQEKVLARAILKPSRAKTALPCLFAGPMLFEGVSNNCAAVERAITREKTAKLAADSPFAAVGVSMIMGVSNGSLASAGVQKKMPGVPPILSSQRRSPEKNAGRSSDPVMRGCLLHARLAA